MKHNLIAISGKIGSGKDTVGKILQCLSAGYCHNEIMIALKENDVISQSNYQIKKYADKLKDMVGLLIGCTREQLEDRDFKEKELSEEWWFWKSVANGDRTILKPYNEFTGTETYSLIKLTPRKLMQLLGTECGRQILHPNIWINALFADYTPKVRKENIITSKGDKDYFHVHSPVKTVSNWIITDSRFPDDVEYVKSKGGIVIRVNRITGNLLIDNDTHSVTDWQHPSETALDNYQDFDFTIENDSSLEELIEKIKQLNLV